MGNKGIRMRLVVEVEGRGKWCLQQYSLLEINRISECKMGTTVKIWTEAWGISRVFKSQNFLAVKFIP